MRYTLVTLLLLFTLMLQACGDPKKPQPVADESGVTDEMVEPACDCYSDDLVVDSLMELPKGSRGEDTMLIHCAYIVNYNKTWRIPDWVAYELTAWETRGEEKRTNRFNEDPQLNSDPVQWYDYKRSGYDRGHMAPAGDMKWSKKAMDESFFMTNICPQDSGLNQGRWNDLENAVRRWARYDSVVYVVCGPVVEENHKNIGPNRDIAVPKGFFKVVLRQHKEKNQEPQWQAIGFYMDNTNLTDDLCTFVKSVDELEELTHLDFFPNLPDDIENEVEAVCQPEKWGLKPKNK